ncbi:MAG: bifunctional metallophosphatase/5'-nucleotidase [Bacteroidaceae bacterium]|nr:bifunctional metallophosphatase/5'-nucleotidase [Bacteroidaceae bacterium]
METRTKQLKIIFTSDIHGNYFPYDFRHDHWGKGSLQRVYAYVKKQRKRYPDSTILIDGGDMLQGEPTAYYFNYIDIRKGHSVADMCNFVGYDVGVVGNHDIETGHENFDRFVNSCNYPILGANAINNATGLPYFRPYTILTRCGIRLCIIGFITPAIPHWIPKKIWDDMHFEDIKESARRWIAYVKQNERPDCIIGLIHSGMDNGIVTENYHENAVRETVSEVDGFDLVLYGHDHTSNMESVESPSGRSILCVNPGSLAYSISEVKMRFTLNRVGQVVKNESSCQSIYIGTFHNSYAKEYESHFAKEYQSVAQFASRQIGSFANRVDISDAYFGSSAYIDLIQDLQLHVSKAELSFAAPLFFNASIEAGEVKVNNLFNLYRFEDRLYTMRLKGIEIKKYLEMSYALWTCQMHGPDDKLLLTEPMKNNPLRLGFKNFLFNFDSIAGIRYTVDVSKPEGEKVNILSMSDGSAFDMERFYTVAMTAYRANGGGELLTKGAGLTKEEIEARTISSTVKDIRYYLMEYIQEKGVIHPEAHNHWKFIPEDWVKVAVEREREQLFGEANNIKRKNYSDSNGEDSRER